MIVDIEKDQLGDNGWNLEETLVLGAYNGTKVDAIIHNFETHNTYFYHLGGKVWSSNDRQRYVKHVLNQRYKYAKQKKYEDEMPDAEKEMRLVQKSVATRKANVRYLDDSFFLQSLSLIIKS